jgi:hypothetical protein
VRVLELVVMTVLMLVRLTVRMTVRMTVLMTVLTCQMDVRASRVGGVATSIRPLTAGGDAVGGLGGRGMPRAIGIGCMRIIRMRIMRMRIARMRIMRIMRMKIAAMRGAIRVPAQIRVGTKQGSHSADRDQKDGDEPLHGKRVPFPGSPA